LSTDLSAAPPGGQVRHGIARRGKHPLEPGGGVLLQLLGEYVEIESGKRNDRPQLLAALAHAQSTGATLVIAKLDRLARNVHFISSLMEAGVEFVACDLPMADRLTIHILAAVAEYEREMISQRTKAAMAAAKARGAKFGNPQGARPLHDAGKGNTAAIAARRASARPIAPESYRSAGRSGPAG
jgi:DNA invertase Pin-like site-specific DNA recombinase